MPYDNGESYDRSNASEVYLLDHWQPWMFGRIWRYGQGEVVLDIGCGTGTYMIAAELYGSSAVVGLDLSLPMLQTARHKGLSDLAQGDALALPFKTGMAGLVVSAGLMEYVNPSCALREMRRVLRAGGIAIVITANKYSLARMPGKTLFKVLGKPYFCDEPSYRSLVKAAEDSGFAVIRSKMDDGLLPLPRFVKSRNGEAFAWVYDRFSGLFGERNPFSNIMALILEAA